MCCVFFRCVVGCQNVLCVLSVRCRVLEWVVRVLYGVRMRCVLRRCIVGRQKVLCVLLSAHE